MNPAAQSGFLAVHGGSTGPLSGTGSVVLVAVGDVLVVVEVVVPVGTAASEEDVPIVPGESKKSVPVAPPHAATTTRSVSEAKSGRVFTCRVYVLLDGAATAAGLLTPLPTSDTDPSMRLLRLLHCTCVHGRSSDHRNRWRRDECGFGRRSGGIPGRGHDGRGLDFDGRGLDSRPGLRRLAMTKRLHEQESHPDQSHENEHADEGEHFFFAGRPSSARQVDDHGLGARLTAHAGERRGELRLGKRGRRVLRRSECGGVRRSRRRGLPLGGVRRGARNPRRGSGRERRYGRHVEPSSGSGRDGGRGRRLEGVVGVRRGAVYDDRWGGIAAQLVPAWRNGLGTRCVCRLRLPRRLSLGKLNGLGRTRGRDRGRHARTRWTRDLSGLSGLRRLRRYD